MTPEPRPINIIKYQGDIFYPTYIKAGKHFINISGDKVYNKMFNKYHAIFTTDQGYAFISVSDNYKNKMYLIHRLVAETFKLHLDNRNVVNHKDRNKLNNNNSNLEWVYGFENARHGFNIKNYKYNEISESGNLYTKEEVTDIYTSTLSDKELLKKYSYKNINKRTLNDIRNDITYKYITKYLEKGRTDIYYKRKETTDKLNDKYFVEKLWFEDYFKKEKTSILISEEKRIPKFSLLNAFRKFNLPVRKGRNNKKYKMKLIKTDLDHDVNYFSNYYYKLWLEEMLINNKGLEKIYEEHGKGHNPGRLKKEFKKLGLPTFTSRKVFKMAL